MPACSGPSGNGKRTSRPPSIDLTADAGMVILVGTDYLETDLVEYFSVARSDERGWITTKTHGVSGPP